MQPDPSKTTARFILRHESDRKFDINFWQEQSSEARLNAVSEMVIDWLIYKGRSDELRIQRNVVSFGTRRR